MFILPWLLGFLLLTAWPMIYSLYLSFTNYNLFTAPKWIGINNYVKMLTRDSKFKLSLRNTLKFVGMAVPAKLIFALFIASWLNKNVKGMSFYRTAIYLPSLLGGSVAVAVVWRNIFGSNGYINTFLGYFGISAVPWLTSTKWAMFTLVLLNVWQFGSSMLIFLSSLKQIPASLYEAGAIDGANSVQRFFKITLPLLTPTIFFNLVMQMINGFLAFTQCYIITQGKPMNSTLFYTVYMYQQSFEFYKAGYGAALAWVMLVIIALFTALLFATKRFWVYEDKR